MAEPIRVVMTGGGGFIGSYLLARLVGAGMDVTLVGPHTGKSRYTASLVEKGIVRFLRCDGSFTDEDLLPRILRSADALLLLGYVMPTSSSPAQRLLDELTCNVSPTLRLVRAALRSRPHVVFASSVSVYGVPPHSPVSEDDRPSPSTPYAIAKLVCEEAIQLLCGADAATASILRYSTVYGPGEVVPRAIPNFIRATLAGTPLIVNGDGQDEHDYVHVADVVDATMEALRRRAAGVFNVGTGIGTTTFDLAKLVLKLADTSTPILSAPGQPGAGRRLQIVCDTEAARTALGFVARRSLPEGISEEIGWFRSEQDQCARASSRVARHAPAVARAVA